jgi:hypothetical protein
MQGIKLAGVTVVLTLATLAPAQDGRIYRDGSTWVQEVSGELSEARNLRVKLDTGSVKVQGGDQSKITYVVHRRTYKGSESDARREFESNRINAMVKGDTAWIVSEGSGSHNRSCSDDVVINVPRSTEAARIETGGGSVSAAAIAGHVEIQSGGGSIHVDDIGGLRAETGGGTMEVGNVSGDLTLQTGGGNLKIGSVKGGIRASTGGGSITVTSGMQDAVLETGAGSIHVNKCNGSVKAETGGGSIELGDIGGSVEMQSGAGSIRLASAKGRVVAETGGGSIQLDGASSVRAETAAGGIVVKLVSPSDTRNNSSLETAAGDITVYLADNLPITVRATIELANGHTIRSEFDGIHVTTEGGNWPGPRTIRAEGQLNGGGPSLRVQTNSGNISFRRVSQ